MTPERTETELSVRELRAKLADVITDASVYGQITHVTNRGRRAGAVIVSHDFFQQAKADRAVVEALRAESPDVYARLTS